MDIQNTQPQTETQAYLEDAVAEYIYARNSIQSAFLFGIIQLGGILHKHREELKKHWTWLKFCSSIWLHIAQANQQIRMYDLSLQNTRMDIIKKTITNWTKLNMFMSLSEEDREELIDLAEKWDITPVTSADEFRGAIHDIKGIDVNEEVSTEVIPTQTGRNPLHENSKYAAEAIRSAAKMSHAAKPFLEAYSSIQKAIEILRGESAYPAAEEKELKETLEAQVKELVTILSTL